MKTIPEKIDKGFVGCLITPNLINSINSLIDVLTEQQKEIDTLQYLEDKRQSREAGESVGKQYTAMRSTGEWCVCPKPMQCNCLLNGNKCGECHSCHKLLKPQEDIREKIAFLRQTIPDMTESERKSGWYLSGYYKAIDRTLAIVKGE